MPSDASFDIVSEIDLQEMDNAINQAIKEVTTRYDFKGTAASVSELNRKEKELTLTADAEPQLDSVKKVLVEKIDRKSTRLNSSHANISYAVFCLKKKNKQNKY